MKKPVISLLGIILLSACANYHYDEELQQKIVSEGEKKTKAWFAKHLPDAKDIVIETLYIQAGNFITNITDGTFVLSDSVEYDYLYNWESDSCVTTIGASDSTTVKTALHGYTISNQDQFAYTHSIELRREPITLDYDMVLTE